MFSTTKLIDLSVFFILFIHQQNLTVRGILNCRAFKATTAFYTLPGNYFDNLALAIALKKEGSFLCCDLAKPTNIEFIAELAYFQEVSEIYLSKFRMAPNQKQDNTNLLHGKVYLFEMEQNEAKIIIGSHNLTPYALEGINIESSILVECKQNDWFYHQTLSFLEKCRKHYCEKFDLNKIAIYKQMQSNNAYVLDEYRIENVISLIGKKMDGLNLSKENVIQLFSFTQNEYRKFKTQGDSIYLHCFDYETKKTYLYKSRISQTGVIREDVDKLKIEFTNPIRYANIGTKHLIFLHEERKITPENLQHVEYFVKLTIDYAVENPEVYKTDKSESLSYWKKDDKYSYLGKGKNSRWANELKFQISNFYPDKKANQVLLFDYFENQGSYLLEFYSKIDDLIKAEGISVNKPPNWPHEITE